MFFNYPLAKRPTIYTKTLNIVTFAVLMLLLISIETFAQERTKWIRWGLLTNDKEKVYEEGSLIYIGVSQQFRVQQYDVNKTENWNHPRDPAGTGEFKSITAPIGYSFGVGIPIEIQLHRRFDVVFHPGANIPFSGPSLKYAYLDPSLTPSIKSGKQSNWDDHSNFSSIELPIYGKIKFPSKSARQPDTIEGRKISKRIFYISTGVKYGYYVGASKHYQSFDPSYIDPGIILKPNHWTIEAGLGLDLYFTYFKLSPEIRFSQSVGNLLDKTHPKAIIPEWPNPFMNAIDRLSLRSIQFSLIFR